MVRRANADFALDFGTVWECHSSKQRTVLSDNPCLWCSSGLNMLGLDGTESTSAQ